MSVFSFVDRIVEFKKNESLTAHFTLRGDEEFLEDHFNGFPVMPGVLLLEAVKQAAAAFLEMTGRSTASTDVPRSKDCGLEMTGRSTASTDVPRSKDCGLEMTGRSTASTDVPRSKDCGPESSLNAPGTRYRLVKAEEVRFGQFVKPGSLLEVSVRLTKAEKESYFFDGRISLFMGPPPAEGGSLPVRQAGASGGKVVSRGKALTASFCLEPV